MVVHLDVLILQNVIVNYFLLYITSQTVRLKMGFKKTVLPALIGGIYVLVEVFPKYKIFARFPFKMLVALIMILILFRKRNFIFNLKVLAIYILYTMLLGGLCFFIELNQGVDLQAHAVAIKFNYKKMLLCLSILYMLIDRIIIYIKDRKDLKTLIYTVDIITRNKESTITAFLDTGNELREPATNLPVIIIERSYINNFYINDKEKLYIPYKVVNGQVGRLEGFKPEYVVIHSEGEAKKREVIIAFSDNKLSEYNEYHALLSRGIV